MLRIWCSSHRNFMIAVVISYLRAAPLMHTSSRIITPSRCSSSIRHTSSRTTHRCFSTHADNNQLLPRRILTETCSKDWSRAAVLTIVAKTPNSMPRAKVAQSSSTDSSYSSHRCWFMGPAVARHPLQTAALTS